MGTARQSTEMGAVPPAEGADDVAAESTSVPKGPLRSADAYATIGHDVLFGDDDAADRCDVCGIVVEEDAGEGPEVPGHAFYVWTRGEETRREEPPLCASCAAALGLSALGRWEIEEEEG